MNQDWLKIAQVYATLAQTAAQRATAAAAADVNLSLSANKQLEESQTWQRMAEAALRAAGVEG